MCVCVATPLRKYQMELTGTQLTFEGVYKKCISDTEFARVDLIKVYLGGTPIGTFHRSIEKKLRHLFKVNTSIGQLPYKVFTENPKRFLIHAEDRGEYVLLWLNDFTGKKPTRREAILIKA